MQIEKPYWSDNIYMEHNIENLEQCYIRANQDLKDIRDFFSLTAANEDEIIISCLDQKKVSLQKKPEIRIQFEEKCYLTKLTYTEVQLYFSLLKKRIADIQ